MAAAPRATAQPATTAAAATPDDPADQTTRTLTDAVVVFEVLSDDSATTDRVVKLIDHAAVPSLRG